jgi:hypothetical protein
MGLAVVFSPSSASPFEVVGAIRFFLIDGGLGGGIRGTAQGQHADQVAVPHRAFRLRSSLSPPARDQQIPQHIRFEFGPKLVLGGEGWLGGIAHSSSSASNRLASCLAGLSGRFVLQGGFLGGSLLP